MSRQGYDLCRWYEGKKAVIAERCIHCGKVVKTQREGQICDDCYSKYTPGALADLEG